MKALTDAQLVKMSNSGRADATEELFRRYKRKMGVLACKYRLPGYDIEDGEGVAAIGFMKAIRTFDENGGRNFASWAEMVIKQAFVSEARKVKGPDRIPSWAVTSIEEEVGDDLTIGETVASTEPPRAYVDLAPKVAALERAQSHLVREHLKRPMRSTFGDLLYEWSCVRKDTAVASLMLDVFMGTNLVRIMRFGHDGDVFSQCSVAVWECFRSFAMDQRALVVKLAREAKFGNPLYAETHPLEPVHVAMRRFLVTQEEFENLAA